MIRNPGYLAHDHANIPTALCNPDSEQLFYCGAISEIVDQRRYVVEPVRVGNALGPGRIFTALLEGAMKIPDLGFNLDHRLSLQFRDEADYPVHCGM